MSKTVSFSQFSTYLQCPHKWRLDYIENRRAYIPSIHTCFGTAFHNTVQTYLTIMFNESVKKANEIDLSQMLKEQMFNEYKNNQTRLNEHFSSPEELAEFHRDGVAILNFFQKKRTTYFSTKKQSLVGIEVPLEVEIRPGVVFKAFLDVVIKDEKTGKIRILDFKTSTRGWTDKEKKNMGKTSQLILYKSYYSKIFNVSEDMIDVEFLIVRRKINEDAEFVPKRIQSFKPAAGKVTVKKVNKAFEEFVNTGFLDGGEYNVESEYPAYENSNCKYCEYSKSPELCPVKNRIQNGKATA